MSQSGPLPPMKDKCCICVSEYFLESRAIDIPKEWLEPDRNPCSSNPHKVLMLIDWPSREKTKYHDIFYEKYFEKYPEER